MKKFNTTLFRQLMAALLCVAMLLPMCVVSGSATEIPDFTDETVAVITTETTEAAAEYVTETTAATEATESVPETTVSETTAPTEGTTVTEPVETDPAATAPIEENNVAVNTEIIEVTTSGSTTGTTYTVIAGSDFQNTSNDHEAGAAEVTNLLNQIVGDHGTADGFLFAGDYYFGFSDTESLNGKVRLQKAVQAVYPDLNADSMVWVQGNHETPSMATDEKLSASGAHDATGYGVYVINEKDYMWYNDDKTIIEDTAAELETYLNEKITANYNKPIFVVSHLPLHYNMRTKYDGDGMYANYIFDVLNAAGAKGLNIIFLFGHNHSNGWDDYLGGAAIYLAKGDSINIAQESQTLFKAETLNFTYMNAGYVAYYRNVNTGAETDLTMTVFKITGNEVTISRYSAAGLHDLKSVGVTNSAKNESGYTPDYKTYTSSQTVQPANVITDSTGVMVVAPGITSVTVKKATSSVPTGYGAYLTYDVSVKGFTTGNAATVTLPVDSSFDASKPTVVIDHERNRVIPVQIANGNVVFTTDHFSLYTVAQVNGTAASATVTQTAHWEHATELVENVPYVITSVLSGYVMTGEAATKAVTNVSTPHYGLVLADEDYTASTHKWYYQPNALIYNDPTNTAGYMMISYNTDSGVTLGNLYLGNGSQSTRKPAMTHLGSGEFTIFRINTNYRLNQHGGSTSTFVTSYIDTDELEKGSKWYFNEYVEDRNVTLTVTPSMDTVVAGKTISLYPAVVAGGADKDEYTITYVSSDPTVAVVSSTGVVTGYKTGRVTITATLTAVGGYALTTPAVVEIPLSVVTVSKNDIIVTGSGVIGQYPVKANGEDIKTNTPYVIRSYTDALVLSNVYPTATHYDTKKGLALASTDDLSHVWYYDGSHLRYGSATGTDNYLVYVKDTDLYVGTGTEAQTTFTISYKTEYSRYAIKYGDTDYYVNQYGSTANKVAFPWSGWGSGSTWAFYEITQADAELSAFYPKSTLTVGDTMNVGYSSMINGVSMSDATVVWESSDESIISLSNRYGRNGVLTLTAMAAGNVVITGTMTHVGGYELDIPAVVEIPVTVTVNSADGTSVTTSAVVGDFMGESVSIEEGVTSGPYVLFSYDDGSDTINEVLTGNKGVTSAHGTTGLELTSVADMSHLWYYDGTHMLYGSPAGSGNYLAYVNGQVTLARNDDGVLLFNQVLNYSGTRYYIASTDFDGHLNQLGGRGQTAVGVYTNNSPYFSQWLFVPAYKNANVSLSVSPGSGLVNPGDSLTLAPTVWLEGKVMDSYAITWSSSNTSAATVDANGKVTGVNGGHVIVTATLTAVDGGTLPTPISVEIPIQVATVTKTSSSITVSADQNDTLQSVTTLEQGVPYVITSALTGKILTGVTAETNHWDVFTGLRVTSADDLSHVWYLSGSNLIYGTNEDVNNYMLMHSNNDVLLGAFDDAMDVNSVTKTNSGTSFMMANSDHGKYVHYHGGADFNVMTGSSADGNSTSGSAWIFNTVVEGKNVSLTVSPASSTIYAGESVTLTPTVKVDGVVTTNYSLTWATSDYTIASVHQGAVTGNGGGDVTITATLKKANGEKLNALASVEIPVKVIGIQSGSFSPTAGTVAQRASAKADTGVDMTVTYTDGTTKTVDVTVSMLKDASGNRVSTYNAGTFSGLTVNYGGYAASGFTLNVVASTKPNYPTYPAEGSVVVDKSGTAYDDFRASALAQIELTAKGIPVQTGADVIIMLDTSSSMNMKVDGTERIAVLRESLNNLISTLRQKGPDNDWLDIRVAIADFNGYFHDDFSNYYINANDTVVNNAIRGTDYAARYIQVFTGDHSLTEGAFVNIEDVGTFNDKFNTSIAADYTLNTYSGTNYDYAFDAVYQLASSITEANSTGEERDLFVVFMSDGAPFQYNYYSAQSNYDSSVYWNNWLQGTMTDGTNDTVNMYAPGANRSYYNADGKHWMAEAIKGSPTKDFDVIRKNDPADTNNDNWITLPGLGATMYSIGFCLMDDNYVTVESMDAVIKKAASSDDYYFKVDTASELEDAFGSIATDILYAASDAYFVDTMGAEYDLRLAQHTYKDMNNKEQTVSPTIEVKSYTVYTHADFENGLCTEAQIGERTGTYTTLETVTFNADGTEAYTGGDTSVNILKDGVICANTFWYNTTASAKTIDLSNGKTYSLPAETFYWKIGSISINELAMTYYVYLENALESPGHSSNGSPFATNESAVLYYTNYLGNPCSLDTESPTFPWSAAGVQYGFYLVDRNGNPINSNGEITTFANATKVSELSTEKWFRLNFYGSNGKITASNLTLPEGYHLYDSAAAFQVKQGSNGYGEYKVTTSDRAGMQTTYVDGNKTEPTTVSFSGVTGSGTKTTTTTTFDNLRTDVWFAVVSEVACVPDTVVVDFGRTVYIDVRTNDNLIGTDGTVTGLAKDSDITGYSESSGKTLDQYLSELAVSQTPLFEDQKVQRTNGYLELTTNSAGYKPRYVFNGSKAMQMTKEEVFVYAMNYTGSIGAQGYYYSTVTVIPATTIYYEDTFLSYAVYDYDTNVKLTDSSVKWTTDGEIKWPSQAQDRPGTDNAPAPDSNNNYGYDGTYASFYTYSQGQSHKVRVGTYTPEGSTTEYHTYATATFTFAGTGFDVISMTSDKTGTITMQVTNTEDSSKVYNYLIDTYYGYSYKDTNNDGVKEWVPADGEYALYQVPIIKAENLPYGTYKVVITVSHAEFFDHAQYDGKYYDFYLDAIRVYDSANDGVGNQLIEDAYVADNEGWPAYTELRNLLISANDFADLNGTTVVSTSGIVFIDSNPELDSDSATGLVGSNTSVASKKAEIRDYINYGPNNELYLAKGQGVAFELNQTGNVASVQLAVKSVGSTSSEYAIMNIYDVTGNTINRSSTVNIKTATDMYYVITKYNSTTSTPKTVVIKNTGDAILSITNIKVTYTSNPAASANYEPNEATRISQGITVSASAMQGVLEMFDNMSEQDSVESADSGEINVIGASLSFEDEILTNLYYTTSNLEGVAEDDMGLLTWSTMPENGTIENAENIFAGAVYDTTNERYMVRTSGIAAKNLGDDIYMRVYAQLGDGSYVYGDVITYSPKQYAMSRLANSSNENLKALCVALLNYGAAAQNYFGYKTDTLMNAELTAEQQAFVTAYSADLFKGAISADAAKVGTFAATESGFGAKSASVSFEGAFAINYYFAPNATVDGEITYYYWTADAYAAAETLTAENATGTVTMIANANGVYWAQISDIAAKQLDDTCYVAAVYTSNGETCSSGVIAYSLSTYCMKNASTDMGELAQATAMYGYYAKKYFN